MATSSGPRLSVAVAFSGGRDSTALLHATLRAAADLDIVVWALHVHHGLSAHADAWERHCAARCAGWAADGWPVQFAAERLTPTSFHPHGVEAWARDGRYAALADMARAAGAGLVLLAHHRRDQAETVVLQALRGGGVDGWSAMPAVVERAGLSWARPWLDVPREAIDHYVADNDLAFIDDDSNTDRRHARNRLRLQVWPALIAAFPQAEEALVGAAQRAQDASSCLADLARLDLGAAADGSPLDIAAWLALSTPRRGNALRSWLRAATGGPVPATVVARLLAEVPVVVGSGRGGRRWVLSGDRELRCWRGRLTVRAASTEAAGSAGLAAEDRPIGIGRPGRHRVDGWAGWLEVRVVESGGVAIELLNGLRPRTRRGGERFQLSAGRPARSLKLQFQSAGVPSWSRRGPLLYDRDRLVFVPGLGLDARMLAAPGVPQALLAWEPDPPADGTPPR